jgi:alpha-mannosidase
MDAPEMFRWRTHHLWAENPPIMPSAAFRGLRLRPLGASESLPVQIESMSRASVLRPGISGPSSFRDAQRVRTSFRASIPALGYQVYAVRPESNPNHPITPQLPHHVLENEHLRVQIQPNGTLTVTEKASGQTYRDLAYFEDGGDCGDGYNYSYPLEDRLETTLGLAPRISRLAEGPAIQRYRIEYDWQLPESLDDLRRKRRESRTLCPLTVTVSLAQGSPRLDLQVEFDNHARDHRLRLIFPSDIQTSSSHADAQFAVIRRPIQIHPVSEEAWVEDAPRTFPQQGWLDLSDGSRGLCLINQGLPEYEVLDTERREIAITLLRSVAYLGAGTEMRAAVIGAGPNVPTPGAQIQRKLTYHLSIFPHSGEWHTAEVWRQAQAHNLPPRSATFGMIKNYPVAPGTRPARQSFLAVTGKNAILSAFKKAEVGDSLLLRLYNPSPSATHAEILPPFAPAQARLADLAEQPIPAAEIQPGTDGVLRVEIPAGKVITLRLERDAPTD